MRQWLVSFAVPHRNSQLVVEAVTKTGAHLAAIRRIEAMGCHDFGILTIEPLPEANP